MMIKIYCLKETKVTLVEVEGQEVGTKLEAELGLVMDRAEGAVVEEE